MFVIGLLTAATVPRNSENCYISFITTYLLLPATGIFIVICNSLRYQETYVTLPNLDCINLCSMHLLI